MQQKKATSMPSLLDILILFPWLLPRCVFKGKMLTRFMDPVLLSEHETRQKEWLVFLVIFAGVRITRTTHLKVSMGDISGDN